jgi:hypothetical protein
MHRAPPSEAVAGLFPQARKRTDPAALTRIQIQELSRLDFGWR